MKLRIFLSLLMFSAILVSCKKDDDNKPTPNTINLNAKDKEFMVSAAYSHRAAVELGQLAATKGSSDSVKMLGNTLVSAYQKALNELKTLSTEVGVAVPDSLDAAHNQRKITLSGLTGYTFDTAYMRTVIEDHKDARTFYNSELLQGNETKVKDYANKYLSQIEMYLKDAERIESGL